MLTQSPSSLFTDFRSDTEGWFIQLEGISTEMPERIVNKIDSVFTVY